MGRGVSNTGTITLTQIRNAYTYDASNILRTDTYDTPGSGSSTAPSGAVWVKAEAWSGGGGGRGYSILTDLGGGGGGYVSYIFPVTGGSTTLNYTVGSAGSGGAVGANGTTGGSSSVTVPDGSSTISMSATGGGGGLLNSGGLGGNGSPSFGTHILNSSSSSGANGTASVGGNAAGGGGSGGATNGAAGSAPGGGGAPGITSGTAGGNGAAGRVKLTWYGASTANSLRSYLRAGSYVGQGAAGVNGIIPSSGTLKVSDFKGVDEVGFTANTLPGGSAYLINDIVIVPQGTPSATANANCAILSSGRVKDMNTFNRWLMRLTSEGDPTIASYFDVQFIRTSASGDDTTLYGSAANTWIQASTIPSWVVKATTTSGPRSSSANGFLLFRRRSDSVVISNVAVTLTADVSIESGS